MENLIFSANIILPILILFIIGYLTKQFKLLNPTTVKQGNALVFKIFLPVLLCKNVMSSDLSNLTSPNLYIFCFIAISLMFIIMMIIVPRIEKENKRRGVMIQGICRSNYAIFGIPLVELLFPNTDTAAVALLVAIVIPVYNVFSVIALTLYSEKKANVKNIVKGIAKNPLIIATIVGIILLFANITFPPFVNTSINYLSGMATPLALIMLGASFEFKKIKSFKNQLIIATTGKLLIMPLIIMSIAIALGFRGVELASIMIATASPTGISSYSMAQQMDCDSDLAGAIVVFTSVFCILTVFLLIFGLKSFALI